MPTISRFYGIVVFINYRDHAPPHFHARYGAQEVTIEIQTGIVTGKMSRRALNMLFDWLDLHRDELMDNWNRARNGEPLQEIPPLLWEQTMFLHVEKVKHLGDFKLQLTFNDGVVMDVDLEDELYGPIFEPLKDVNLFQQVTVNSETNTIEWPNGADFAPEFLRELGYELARA